MEKVLPSIAAANAERYTGYTIRQVCKEMHDYYREADIKTLQRKVFRAEHFPEQAMSPQAAVHQMVANNVEYVKLRDIKGRIGVMLALIYPPGIGVVVPGERWDDRAQPMITTS